MAVGYTRVNPDKLFNFSNKVLEKMGVPAEEAAITSRLLVDTDFRGIESHGIAHLGPFYIKRMKDGLINPKPNIKTWSDSASNAVMDGDNGLGFVCGYRAMQEAITRARLVGAGFVSVRNTTHYGACSAYSLLAAKENMVGFSCTTGGRGAVAPGGSGREIGINAMSIAVPSGNNFPFCLDMSTTIVAHGKIEIAQRLKKNVPAGWQVDPDGFPIINPQEELERRGAMALLGSTPEMGVYKGFGLNVMIEILSSILSDSPTIVEIGGQPKSQGKCTHFCGAIKISGFLPMGDFARGMENMYKVYHNVPKAKGVERITLAGEPEWEIEQDRRKNGIPLDDEVIGGLKGLSNEFNIPYDL
jgi:LDH2 family malate/lactate/ureidoglycolate dehydrogenase